MHQQIKKNLLFMSKPKPPHDPPGVSAHANALVCVDHGASEASDRMDQLNSSSVGGLGLAPTI